jgi:hypothetical protein
LKAPAIVAGEPRPFRRWDEIHRRTNLGVAEVRLQSKVLFPKAPLWNPLSKLKLPALRIVKKSLAKAALERITKPHQQHYY